MANARRYSDSKQALEKKETVEVEIEDGKAKSHNANRNSTHMRIKLAGETM